MLASTVLLSVLAAVPQARRPRHVTGDMVGEIAASGATYAAIVLTAADVPARATVFYSKDRSLLASQPTRAASVGPIATSVAGTAKLEISGLVAGTRYFYRTRLANPNDASVFEDGQIGELTTPPTGPAVVKFAFSGDFAMGTKHPILDAVVRDDPAFYVSLGDFPYCDVFAAKAGLSLASYRLAHAMNRLSPDLQRFLYKVPVFAILDDHEVLDNWDLETRQLLPQIVSWGRTAFADWLPIRPALPGVFYRSFAWGPGLRVIVLDTRSHRGRNRDPDLAQHSMLGTAQRLWLENELKTATETFKVIVSSVPLRSGYKLRDHWEGYQRERRWLFDVIAKHKVRNVVFLTGDHHFAALNHHPEGHVEMLAGPLTAGFAKPPNERLSITRSTYGFWNYGLVTVDTTKQPRTLTLECRSGLGTVFKEVIEDRAPGELELSSCLGDARFAVSGPRFLAHRGGGRYWPSVAPGRYRVTAQSVLGRRSHLPSVDVVVEPGGYASVGIAPAVTRKLYDNRLLADDFSTNQAASSSQVVDLGSGPSAWFSDDGSLWQSSRIAGVAASEPGTLYLRGEPAWTDQVVRVGVRSWDSGQIGVIARYRDSSNYYHFQFDRALGTRTLSVVSGGKRTILAADRYRFDVDRRIEIELGVVGRTLWVDWNGERILTAKDKTHAAGRVALSVANNEMVRFDRLRVYRAPPTTGRSFYDSFSRGKGAGWVSYDAGKQGGPGRWLVPEPAIERPGGGPAIRSNGVLRQVAKVNGTILYRAGSQRDFALSCKLRGETSGALGVVFRLQGPQTYYRFQMDATNRLLERVVGGKSQLLAGDTTRGFEIGRWYELEVVVIGDRLSVRLDGEEILNARDAALDRGGFGFYTFANAGAWFDDVAVDPVDSATTLATLVSQGPSFALTHYDPAAVSGDLALVLMSTVERPPIDLSFTDPANRLLPLKLGELMQASVASPGVATFDASGTAQYRFPASAGLALRGLRLVVGGVRVDVKHGRLAPLASTPVRLR